MGLPVISLLEGSIPGLRAFPHLTGPGVEMPSTPGALWCWLRGDDRGELYLRGRDIEGHLSDVFEPIDITEGFFYGGGRDLTGYEDGTENPTGDRAAEVALVSGQGPGLDGSSFVAVQHWLHDLQEFESMEGDERDATVGRRRSDNEEIDDAPPSAHVKRTAQESFQPEAFVLRRSMPWAEGREAGLVFVAFGATLDPFEALSRRMVGLEDGITDALFRFTRPLSGNYFWCPPVLEGRLDLRAL
jgi:putative iron-dependent peroxidase